MPTYLGPKNLSRPINTKITAISRFEIKQIYETSLLNYYVGSDSDLK